MISANSAGVRFPPPLLYLIGLVAGILLGRLLPGTLPRTPLAVAVAVAFILIGLPLMSFARGLFLKRGTNVNPTRPSTVLVTDGPYRYTRNPMYVGVAAIYVGIALIFLSLWALILLVPILIIIRYFVIAKEERYLLGVFGDEYRSFAHRVRRWI
ncbi:MAG: isoprenylcysteine carboxyl methyltransferase [Candidatus Meridianibacter frigidus]|nr:MAG: isoprenylcysteine carboxyl methyltransferase [Candidatus Eremiobacteraeota bacterium]